MRVTSRWLLAGLLATALLAGCGGGSDETDTVNGCAIEPGTSCPSADLSGADLAGADLTRATLASANLQETDLSEANLTEAILTGAQMIDTDLSDADLTGANLLGATIVGAVFDGATLCGTTRPDGTVDDTGCEVTTDTTGTTTLTAEVTSFELGDLDCGAATTGPVAVTWTTTNAIAVEIAVDSVPPARFGPSGTTTVVVPCDDQPHTVTLTALSTAGTGEAESDEVSSG